MPSVAVMNRVVTELATEFTTLAASHDIYLAPSVIEIPGRRPLNIQVCDGGVNYTNFEGGVRTEHFTLLIGILKSYSVDYAGKYQKALADLTESIFVTKESVITTLEGSFLNSLIVRPLRIMSESEIRQGREAGLLIKTLSFIGGMNTAR